MAYFYSAPNFGTGEHFGFYVISFKASQTELQSSRKSDTILTQYADREIPPICVDYIQPEDMEIPHKRDVLST